MKKCLITLSILAAITVIALSNPQVHAQGRDLCGGTGGNGEVISVGSNTFTLKLNEGGQKGGGTLIVHLTDRTTIETPSGYISVSDLKIGDRVTLVGDNNRDGTFTADAVVVCSSVQGVGAQNDGTGNTTPVAVRTKDPEAYERVSGIVNTVTVLLVGLIWLGVVTFLRFKKRKSFVYLLFFTVFYLYLYKILDYTLFQFQSLLLLQYFLPDLMLNGFKDGTNVNLIPIATLTLEDVKTSLLNILMMLPFGFGLPFVSNFRLKQVVVSGFLLSVAIEFLQLVTGLMANTSFRVADINDLIFNTLGAAVGYILFVQFIRIYRRTTRNRKIGMTPILQYISDRPQI